MRGASVAVFAELIFTARKAAMVILTGVGTGFERWQMMQLQRQGLQELGLNLLFFGMIVLAGVNGTMVPFYGLREACSKMLASEGTDRPWRWDYWRFRLQLGSVILWELEERPIFVFQTADGNLQRPHERSLGSYWSC
ncbi:hypothetical protein Mal48_17830 [Thalassoglobus polymorphus]|uniref:Uncharacterized protein n=1 Tax=Thalassoglobus polymorphus TaxID=2527994 RepID=A0A517QLN6_9PLAN|nr:hypothetical protein Mal48_17830 [Thalassoglobus polymorphus]